MEEKMQRDRNRNRQSNNEDGETNTETTVMDDITQTGETDTYQTDTPSTVSSIRKCISTENNNKKKLQKDSNLSVCKFKRI